MTDHVIYEPLPSKVSEYLERLARDLAYGVENGLWENSFYIVYIPGWDCYFSGDSWARSNEVIDYINQVWGEVKPPLKDMIQRKYLQPVQGIGDDITLFELTEKAFDLVKAVKPISIFISYRRVQSSAFALLLWKEFRSRGLSPFLDTNDDPDIRSTKLNAGDDWRDTLKRNIENAECVILLLGPESLKGSSFVVDEIKWALDTQRKIMPIHHNGFDPNNPDHVPPALPTKVIQAVQNTHGYSVQPEAPMGYTETIKRVFADLKIKN